MAASCAPSASSSSSDDTLLDPHSQDLLGESVIFRLLTWNIDGLDPKNTVDRAKAVCCFIKAKLPHAVFLQEVVAANWAEIVKELSSMYDCYSSDDCPMGYYVAILVLKKAVKVTGSSQIFSFDSSTMGRKLLQLPISFAGAKILLLTSHLESTGDPACSQERKRQLKIVFDRIKATCAEQPEISCIFGGDLNLRDKELKGVGLPAGMVDVWEANGSPQSEKFTWDLKLNDNLDWQFPNRPSCRFDRVYLMSGVSGGLSTPSQRVSKKREGSGAEPASKRAREEEKGEEFVLVGKVRLSKCGGRFPSDHWGIWTEFDVKYQ